MITIKTIIDKTFIGTGFKEMLLSAEKEGLFQDGAVKFLNIDSTHFYTAREAKKAVNDYAVTVLPFVLLIDDTLPEDKQEYAAVYSEEGPITVDRINEKL